MIIRLTRAIRHSAMIYICCDAKNSHGVCIEGEMMTATHLNHAFSVACTTFNCLEYKVSALKS